MLALTHNPCQSRGYGLSLSALSPVTAEAVRTFASIVEKGAATAKAFAAFVKEGTKREGRSPISRSGKRVAPLCRVVTGKYAGTRGATRFARTARPGCADVEDLRRPVRYFQTRKKPLSPVDNDLELIDG